MGVSAPAAARASGRWQTLVLAVAVAVATFVGYRLFLFITDDAFIAFRYVSNHRLGHGFVWNPPPFLPVEGYTSFLWVVLLRVVWGLTGLEPPAVANTLSLLFGYATLFVVYRMLMRIDLPRRLERHRLALAALVFLGTITNRTFLAWLSSGLETALFNFTVTLWAYHALTSPRSPDAGWVFRISLAATLTALTRPDGLLFVLATVVLLGERLLWWDVPLRASLGQLLWAFPLLGSPLHLLWRRGFYGTWLPNTYYAKHTEAWPESGWRYAASFVLEYAVWIWLLLVLAWLIRGPRLGRPALIALAALLAHLGYYTVAIGGDHFEYRVYSHLVPLLLVSFVWLLARLDTRPAAAVALLAVFIAASWAIPWTHWVETRHLTTRQETFRMTRPVAGRFPSPVRFYPRAFDTLQAWLIRRSVCMRHQEHKIYSGFVGRRLPTREQGAKLGREGRPVLKARNVGVVGWVLPHVAVIDLLGLNDYVIARSPVRVEGVRQMAHDRRAPPGYTDCFQPNLWFAINFPDPPTLVSVPDRDNRVITDDRIVECERRFREQVRK